jgi:hypothetical protein
MPYRWSVFNLPNWIETVKSSVSNIYSAFSSTCKKRSEVSVRSSSSSADIIDSGWTHTMVHRADRCSSINYKDPKSVTVADGKNLWSNAYPCVLRGNSLDLPHWLLHEDLPRTFVSQREVKALGHRTVYEPFDKSDYIQKPDGSKVPLVWKNNLPHIDLNFSGPTVSSLRYSVDTITNFSIEHDDTICQCKCGLFWSAWDKLLLHRQRGHFHDPKIKVFCPDC